jgi:hypothetical protein
VPLLFLGISLFGAGIEDNTSLPPLIAQAEFDKEDIPRVVPLIVAISQGTYAFAPAAFGIIRALGCQWSSISGGGSRTMGVHLRSVYPSSRRCRVPHWL